ncbi:protein NRT1/ PTR FAMILY 8.1-like [Dendrobium catenatum]|uniref:protein NRT1/ PTR FAMILY 8.1-like n=1 Tax=Dendrobium catenatum TaxID=906689 RepID=UPI0009F5794B|nr:protein NRT1/ PTR FAMILY 8.1-like [Dendrobium catenatum]
MKVEASISGDHAVDASANRSPSTLVSNGAVDYQGKIADKVTTGGWKAAPFIIVNEVAERIAFFAILINMMIYLTKEMHEALPDASTRITNWIGSAFMLSLLGAFLADSYLGRFLIVVIFSPIYAAGTVLLTLAASIDSLRPPPCALGSESCESATGPQNGVLLVAMALIALGTGGIKPCISTFGADQFDEADPIEARKKSSFFNWFFFALTSGICISITLIAYIEDQMGWAWGFGLSAVINVSSVLILVAGKRRYRYQKPRGSPFTRFLQVFVAASRNYAKGVQAKNAEELFEVKTKESAIYGARKLPHTRELSFLDMAAVGASNVNDGDQSRWRLCTVTQVEELKAFMRILPIWVTTIAFQLAFSQMNFFIAQGLVMNRRLSGDFVVPPGSVPIFAAASSLIFILMYERFIVPLFRRLTSHPRGLSSLQRVGIGLFVSIPTFAVAAQVEHHRRSSAHTGSKLSFWWLFPQYFLLGIAEVLTYVGQLEFFYYEATDGTRSLSSAVFLSAAGVGSWLNTILVKVVERKTGGVARGWLRRDLNRSKLDYLYWIVCAINAVNFCIFYVVVTRFYKGRGAASRNNDDEAEPDGLIMEEKGVNDSNSTNLLI